jgi:hypothetical protein
MLYRVHLDWVGFELTTLVVIGTDSSGTQLWSCSYFSLLILVSLFQLLFRYAMSKCTSGSSWSWSYGSWIYNYLCNQCLSLLKVWVWSLLLYHIMLYQVTDKLYHIMLYQVTDKLYHIMLYQVTDKLYHIMLYQVTDTSYGFSTSVELNHWL